MSNKDWPLVKLGDGDLFRIESGGTPDTKNEMFWDGSIPWLTLVDLPQGNHITEIFGSKRMITEKGLNESSAKLIPENSVIVSSRATIGRVAINRVPVTTNQGFKNIVILRKDKVLVEYLAHVCTRLTDRMKQLAGGSTFAEISKTKFSSLEIPLPPLALQLKIVATLDAASNLKKKREEADKKMAAFAPALFYKMFGDPPTSKGDVKLQKLKEVARVQSGTGFPLAYQGLLDQKYPFFKVGDMNAPANLVEMHEFQHSISEETAQKLHATIFPAGSVVFPKIGAAINTNKKRLLVKPSCVDNNVMVVIPSDAISSGYLFSLFQTKHLRDFASTGNPPSIRKTTVEDWSIPVPQIDFQIRFLSILDDSSQLTKKQSVSRGSLGKLFDAVLSLSI